MNTRTLIVAATLLATLLVPAGVNAGTVTDGGPEGRTYREDFQTFNSGSLPHDTWYGTASSGVGTVQVYSPSQQGDKDLRLQDTNTGHGWQMQNFGRDGLVADNCGESAVFSWDFDLGAGLSTSGDIDMRLTRSVTTLNGSGPVNSAGVLVAGAVGAETITTYVRGSGGVTSSIHLAAYTPPGLLHVQISEMNCNSGFGSALFQITGTYSVTERITTTSLLTGPMDTFQSVSVGTAGTGTFYELDNITWAGQASPNPSISSINPAAGPGGTNVTVTGAGFYNSTVTFAGVAATIITQTSTSLYVTAPPHANGFVDVTVTNPNFASATSNGGYQYTSAPPAQPTVTAVSPTSGTGSLGELANVAGTNFQSGATVFFDAVQALQTVFNGPTSLGVTLDTLPPGTYDVKVVNPGGPNSTLFNAYTVATVPPPTITNVAPSQGTVLGGTAVTVTGTGFSNNGFQDGVTVDGVAATNVAFVSSTRVDFTTPPGATAGSKVLQLTNGNGQTANSTYTYISEGGGGGGGFENINVSLQANSGRVVDVDAVGNVVNIAHVGGAGSTLLLSQSRDGGATWNEFFTGNTPSVVSPTHVAQNATNPDNVVIVYCRIATFSGAMVAVATLNGGLTWSSQTFTASPTNYFTGCDVVYVPGVGFVLEYARITSAGNPTTLTLADVTSANGTVWSAVEGVVIAGVTAWQDTSACPGVASAWLQGNTSMRTVYSYSATIPNGCHVVWLDHAPMTGYYAGAQMQDLGTPLDDFYAPRISNDGKYVTFIDYTNPARSTYNLKVGYKTSASSWNHYTFANQTDSLVSGVAANIASCTTNASFVYRPRGTAFQVELGSIAPSTASLQALPVLTGAVAGSPPNTTYDPAVATSGTTAYIAYQDFNDTRLKLAKLTDCLHPSAAAGGGNGTFEDFVPVTNLLGFDVDLTGTTVVVKNGTRIETYVGSTLNLNSFHVGDTCASLHGVAAMLDAVAYTTCASGSTVNGVNHTSSTFGKPPLAPTMCNFPADFRWTQDVDADTYDLEVFDPLPFTYENNDGGVNCNVGAGHLFSVYTDGTFGLYQGFNVEPNGHLGGASTTQIDGSSFKAVDQICGSHDTSRVIDNGSAVGTEFYIGAVSHNVGLVVYKTVVIAGTPGDDFSYAPQLSYTNTANFAGANTVVCGGSYAYASGSGAGRLVNLTTNTLGSQLVPNSGFEHGAAMSYDGRVLAVMNGAQTNVYTISNNTATQVGIVVMPTTGTYRDMRLTGDGQALFVAMAGTGGGVYRFSLAGFVPPPDTPVCASIFQCDSDGDGIIDASDSFPDDPCRPVKLPGCPGTGTLHSGGGLLNLSRKFSIYATLATVVVFLLLGYGVASGRRREE